MVEIFATEWPSAAWSSKAYTKMLKALSNKVCQTNQQLGVLLRLIEVGGLWLDTHICQHLLFLFPLSAEAIGAAKIHIRNHFDLNYFLSKMKKNGPYLFKKILYRFSVENLWF